jgi:arylsulfatase A-like enzyme
MLMVNQSNARPPNFVFIIADDLGWADVGFHGGEVPTPTLDGLADEGLELTHHYVAPVCSPTRVGLLTGRYWSRFGITTPTNERALPWETFTLPRALKQCGYETSLVGKWHLGSLPQWGPNHFGFDHSYGSLAGGVTAWSHRYKRGRFSRTWHRNEQLIEEEEHVTDLLTREAVQWIQMRDDRPFFLYVPFTAVHLPINEPDLWLDKLPDSFRDKSEIARHYAACVMHLDDSVGRIVAALERKGVLEETMVVFTSDNGGSTVTNNTQPYPPDDSPSGNLVADNGKLRGGKGNVYEGGTRVPTLAYWPGRIKPGKADDLTCIVDWMPTFCQLAGYEMEEPLGWDGIDLSSLLLDRSSPRARSVYIAGPRWRQVSIQSDGWKLITDAKQNHELFHLKQDPFEKQNLADHDPSRLQSMLDELREVRLRDNDSAVQK